MEILKGADVVAAINQSIKDELETMSYIPHLAIVRVGEKPDDISYERGATKRMETVGLRCTSYHYPEDITDEEFKKAFMSINDDEDVDAILLLRPLPKHIKESDIEKMINPVKDVDGISPVNMAKIYSGDKTGFAPCTPTAVIEMLDYAGIDLMGKRVAIVGRSLVVGKPLAMLMIGRNATVTVCHTKTVDMKNTCKKAEIVVAAAGKAKMLDKEYVAEGAVVIDVGINMDENFKLCGDVDFESITDTASMATPVPGGVGTVTTSVLAKHVVAAAKIRRGN
ncbi:MAG: bifunctional 5,10-methylene-tetrahydrofolate dehydrogenase/5,10-methylene-tetrahydrofolate cyclohydrolase [Lachnospiraceae bacterium]|nr:bifunctional 5,10-methylene-tetrahydrofolate dehydrogenase/5,10-methylene-tetrahydrofolate cyclohydrolase [Lachnospiraceae bacterium]